MTTGEVLKQMRAEGNPTSAWVIGHAVRAGHVARPRLNPTSLQFDWRRSDVRNLRMYLKVPRRRGPKAKKKPAAV